MFEALAWGAVAASSLLIGALFGILRPWPRRAIGLVLGFGAGALISAVSFELAQEGVRVGGGTAVGIGLGAGALTYYVCDAEIERRSGGADADAGAALALGAFLDGLPEQLVLGLGIALGDGVSAGLLAAIFVSNLPEAIGSATAMRDAGRTNREVVLLWIGVALICTLATVLGFAIADNVSDTFKGGVNGFAAGALVVMLVDSMIPEATRQAGRTTGLVTTLGFAVAAGMSGIS
jgi:zinc transporter, ZIP family